ncbi:MAG: type IV secretory system conjugative DNA transfer family protein [Oscillospiraceae bacterium]
MYDRLDLDVSGMEPDGALFLIMSDADGTLHFDQSDLFVSFSATCRRADDVYGGRLHPCALLIDEAAISGGPSAGRLAGDHQGREVSACLVLQAQSQLKALYKDNMDTIIGNCDASLVWNEKQQKLELLLGKRQ